MKLLQYRLWLFCVLMAFHTAPPVLADTDWKEGKLGHLAPLIGTYNYEDVFADPVVEEALADLLPQDMLDILHRNLDARAPIDFVSGYLVLSGNRAHAGGEEMASVWIRIYDASALVVLTRKGKNTLFSPATRYSWLPVTLRRYLAAFDIRKLSQPPESLEWQFK